MLGAGSATTRVARDVRESILAYVRLTKPRIVGLLVITTVPAMILAEGGMPSAWLVLATVLEWLRGRWRRERHEYVLRPRHRPTHATYARAAGACRSCGARTSSAVWFAARRRRVPLQQATVNLLAAVLTIGAFAFYVFVYTLILKRSTSLNIVIGGAAGAMPPVIGWAAVTNEISISAVIMFAIVTAWTPPTSGALSLNYAGDYKRAGVPMLPVVAGPEETRKQILIYSLVLVAVSVLLTVMGVAGYIYLTAALVLGTGFLYYAHRLWRDGSARNSMDLFRYSMLYLALLFGAIAVDGMVS